jgi:hypothetical protein
MTPPTMPRPTPAATELFESILPKRPDVQVRKVFGQPAAFLSGHMFLGVFGDQVILRFGPDDLAQAEKVQGVRPFEPMPGRRMGGYLVFPPATLRNPRRLGPWLRRSMTFVKTLPPKPAARARPKS